MIWFKHCYWPEPDRWGVIGLPRGQYAHGILSGNYESGDRVLLALTRNADTEMRGKVCWVCTLHFVPKPTAKIINPEIPPEQYQRWPEAIPIDQLWEVDPFDYGSIAGGKLAEEAQTRRGKLFKVANGQDELALSLPKANLRPIEFYRSSLVQDYVDELNRARQCDCAA